MLSLFSALNSEQSLQTFQASVGFLMLSQLAFIGSETVKFLHSPLGKEVLQVDIKSDGRCAVVWLVSPQ